MTTRVVVKRGQDSWSDLVGKEISFDWFDGYEDFPYQVEGTFEGVLRVVDSDGLRYPRYYITVDGAGYAVWGDEEVRVTVHE